MNQFNCTRCDGTGFLNLNQVDQELVQKYLETRDASLILDWIDCLSLHDVQVCDCCGDGEIWYNEPGLHDWANDNDPKGCQ